MKQLGWSKQKAMIAHKCKNCGGVIEIGQVYFRARMVDMGDAWVWKSHEDCQTASELLWSLGIRGDDDAILKVMDFDQNERDLVRGVDGKLASRLWPKSDGNTKPKRSK